MVMDCCRSSRTSVVKSRPPITAAGMLSWSSHRIRVRSWMPMKYTTAPMLSVCSRSSLSSVRATPPLEGRPDQRAQSTEHQSASCYGSGLLSGRDRTLAHAFSECYDQGSKCHPDHASYGEPGQPRRASSHLQVG